jgi:hypothetical protein
MESSTALTSQQLEDLQLFLKDWLRHTGRTQADLRRALRASSIRMPVLLEALQRIHDQRGLGGLAEHLCEIETLWHSEDVPDSTQEAPAPRGVTNPLDQLDLLLDEIRGAAEERDTDEDDADVGLEDAMDEEDGDESDEE